MTDKILTCYQPNLRGNIVFFVTSEQIVTSYQTKYDSPIIYQILWDILVLFKTSLGLGYNTLVKHTI